MSRNRLKRFPATALILTGLKPGENERQTASGNTKSMTSLEDHSEQEIEQIWIKEAVRRDAELDSGSAAMRDMEDVFRDARSRLT